MSESNPYHPVACDFHDVLESVAVRGVRCEVVYRDEEDAVHRVETRILDVFTEGEEEFARLEHGAKVRLDRLDRVGEAHRESADGRP